VFHIGVAKFHGHGGGGEIGAAILVAAVGDDQGFFILGEKRGDFFLLSDEVDRPGDPTFGEGLRAINVEDGDRLGGEGGAKFLVGNIRDLGRTGKGGPDETEGEDKRGEEFHAGTHKDLRSYFASRWMQWADCYERAGWRSTDHHAGMGDPTALALAPEAAVGRSRPEGKPQPRLIAGSVGFATEAPSLGG
jgi:hypothetical protein